MILKKAKCEFAKESKLLDKEQKNKKLVVVMGNTMPKDNRIGGMVVATYASEDFQRWM